MQQRSPRFLTTKKELNACKFATTTFCRCDSAFYDFYLLPVMDTRTMFAENQSLPFAHNVLMLRSKGNMTTTASAVFDRNYDAIFFVIQESLVNAHSLWICSFREKFSSCFEPRTFFV